MTDYTQRTISSVNVNVLPAPGSGQVLVTMHLTYGGDTAELTPEEAQQLAEALALAADAALESSSPHRRA